MKIISFCNQKGGVGKSSNTLLMAFGLYHRHYKILLIDMDAQRNLSTAVAAKTKNVPSTMELLLGEATAAEAIQHLPCFDIIPARKELAAIEALMPLSGRLKKLKKALAPLTDYDFILVDTPPNLGVLSLNSLVAADELIIPSTASAFSIEGFLDLYKNINDIKLDENPGLIVQGVLISMFNPRTTISRDLTDSIKILNDKYNIKTFETKIRTSTFIVESQFYRFDPYIQDPTNIAVLDFNLFIDEFLGGK